MNIWIGISYFVNLNAHRTPVINSAQSIFFWNITRGQAISPVAKFHHVEGCGFTIQRMVFIFIKCLSAIRINYFIFIINYLRTNKMSLHGFRSNLPTLTIEKITVYWVLFGYFLLKWPFLIIFTWVLSACIKIFIYISSRREYILFFTKQVSEFKFSCNFL